MHVIHKRLVFIAHPRTASRSIRDTLKRIGAKEAAGHHPIAPKILENEKALGASVGCVIRNPFDLLVSWYYQAEISRIRGVRCASPKRPQDPPSPVVPRTFNSWLKDSLEKKVWKNGLFFGLEFCDHVMRFENLQEDFNLWMKKCGMRDRKLGHVGNSERSERYIRHYDEVSRLLVENHFSAELEVGGYHLN